MKIAIGYRVVIGPWGGGNAFFNGLGKHFLSAGHEVVTDLCDGDVDIILLADPRRLSTTSISFNAAWRYVERRNPNAVIVHRINECDERKNTKTMNARLRRCNEVADFTVFVGSWLRDLKVWCPDLNFGDQTILNGSDGAVFSPKGFCPWDGKAPLKLITHHWGGNWMKGFDVYTQIDDMLSDPRWRERISFTYLGNLPKNFRFKNALHLLPERDVKIAKTLRQHHAYVTGSLNEPGGNHQNEAAQCGLPVLYLQSGCMPEYLEGYGIGYRSADAFKKALDDLMANYPEALESIATYPNNLAKTCQEYEALFDDLVTKCNAIIKKRARKRSLAFSLRHSLAL